MFKKKQRQNKRLKKLEKVRKSKGRRFDWIVCPLTIRICRDAGKGSVRDLSERSLGDLTTRICRDADKGKSLCFVGDTHQRFSRSFQQIVDIIQKKYFFEKNKKSACIPERTII